MSAPDTSNRRAEAMQADNSIAVHLGQEFTAAFVKALTQVDDIDDVDVRRVWPDLEMAFARWMSDKGARTSSVNNRLYLLETLSTLLGRNDLYAHPDVAAAILDGSGVAAVGDRTTLGMIVNRALSERLGIFFTIQKEDGTLIRREWFD